MTRFQHARRRLLFLASLVGAIGILEASAGTAQAQAPAAPGTRPAGYYYGGRYYQYNYAAPTYNTAPRRFGYFGTRNAPTRSGYRPGSIYYQSDSPFIRDYSTARDLPFSKPWMRPLR